MKYRVHRTDAPTDGQPENIMPPPPVVGGDVTRDGNLRLNLWIDNHNSINDLFGSSYSVIMAIKRFNCYIYTARPIRCAPVPELLKPAFQILHFQLKI